MIRHRTSTTRYRVLETPTGPFVISVDEHGSVRCGWAALDARKLTEGTLVPDILEDLAQRLMRFFNGQAQDFTDISHPPGPPFHEACWRAARTIPFGATRTYGELAQMAGSPGAARAVGQAMRRNPTPIVIPCHRILAAQSGLGGFAGSSRAQSTAIRTKITLLRLEGHDFD